jgi:hypothetical protein
MKEATTTSLTIFSALISIFTNRGIVDKDDEAIIEMLQTLYLRVVLECFQNQSIYLPVCKIS